MLNKVSAEAMVTMGEWELKSLITFNGSKARNRLRYMVRKYFCDGFFFVDSFLSPGLMNLPVLQVTMERKPMLYVINLIVPLFFFLILDLASFFISEARGEKLSFKVTILLSISVLLLILQDMLPSTEKSLPMIGEQPRRSKIEILMGGF